MTKRELLESLGVETRGERFYLGLLAGFGVGAALAGAAALLWAPRTGRDLRQEAVRKIRTRWSKTAPDTESPEGAEI